jgi:hypothetical protein
MNMFSLVYELGEGVERLLITLLENLVKRVRMGLSMPY